jgi:hypothetical protein
MSPTLAWEVDNGVFKGFGLKCGGASILFLIEYVDYEDTYIKSL